MTAIVDSETSTGGGLISLIVPCHCLIVPCKQ